MSKNLRFAIVGLGRIGRRHAEMLKLHPECDWVAACDPVKPGDIDFTGNGVVFTCSINELLKGHIEFDIASIATPNGLHEEHAIKFLQAGKHVLVEKPLALTTDGAQRILKEAKKRGKHVFCVMQNRYSPVVTWLKEIISRGMLGKIHMVQVSCFWNRDSRYYSKGSWHGTRQLDGGTLFTQFSHFVDILLWLFGDITNITGKFANFNHAGLIDFEDSAMIQFEFSNGGMGCFNYSTACFERNIESSVVVIAEKGTLKIEGQYMDKLSVCHIKDDGVPDIAVSPFGNHYYVFDDIVSVLRNGSITSSTAEEAEKVVEVIERIYNLKLL